MQMAEAIWEGDNISSFFKYLPPRVFGIFLRHFGTEKKSKAQQWQRPNVF
jgi:hypothetical protein